MITELFLYTAKQCELCLEMQKEVQNLLDDKAVIVHVIDINSDPGLQHRYGARIPVLVGGNQEICEVKLDVLALQSFLFDCER